MNFKSLSLTISFALASSLYSMPLSPQSIENLRRSGRLEQVAARQNAAREQGVFAPRRNILEARRQINRDDPDEAMPLPVILVDFADNRANANAHPRAHYESLFFSEGELDPGSMRDWYRENTVGQIEMEGVVSNWVRAAQTYDYYVNGENGFGDYPRNVQRMVIDAVNAANNQIDFSDFDSDGDGEVDAVLIVHAGSGAEQNDGDADMIWSHAWGLENRAIQVDGVRINTYAIIPEDCEIGVAGHELGHALFGLPDLYDRDYSSEGLGDWSMMAGGSWGGGGARPVHFDAWCKVVLGIVQPTVLNVDDDNVVFPPVENEGVIYQLWTQGQIGTQYFLVENRQEIGFDVSLPGSGLCIYHVDETVGDSWNDNEWYPNNQDAGHYFVALEQADGAWELEQNEAADASDPFPGGRNNRNFTNNTTPNSRSYANGNTSVALTNITEDGQNITCAIAIGRQGGGGGDEEEIAYDDGQSARLYIVENYWSKVTFTTRAQFTLGAIWFEPYNAGPNFDAPCAVRVYAEGNGHNLGNLLYQTQINELPAWDFEEGADNWITIDIPQNNRPAFQANANFTIMYGVAPGGEYDNQNLQEGDGWWNLIDSENNFARSFYYEGANPSAVHANWTECEGDLLIRAIPVGGGRSPDITLDQGELDFGTIGINSNRDIDLVVSNIGDAALVVQSVAISGGEANQFSIVAGGGAFNLAQDADRTITVRFRPTSGGRKSSNLRIISNDPDENPRDVPLTGVGSGLPTIVEPAEDMVNIDLQEGGQLAFHFRATDPDGGRLTWRMTNNGQLPQEAEFLDNGDGTADLIWFPDFDEAGRYAPILQVSDPDGGSDQCRLLIDVENFNRRPGVVDAPEDLILDEDPGESVLLNLNEVFEDPDGEPVSFTVAGAPRQFNLRLENDGRLIVRPDSNYFVAAGVRLTATAEDSSNASIQASFRVSINPVNDAPGRFALVVPADSATIRDYHPLFLWDAAIDAELDTVRYTLSFRIQAETPVTLTEPNLLTTRIELSGLDERLLDAIGASDGAFATWWVDATDGSLVTASSTRRTIRIPSLSVENERSLPTEFTLESAYPNPFNAMTTIRYALPKPASVKLSVWDLSGREVVVLIDAERPEGWHEAVWDGAKAVSGQYWLRMEIDGKIMATQKVLLLR